MDKLDNLTIEFDYIFTEERRKSFGYTIDRKYIYNKDYRYVVMNFVLQNGESLQDLGILPEPDYVNHKACASINGGSGCLFFRR